MSDLHFINPARTKAILIGVSEYDCFPEVKAAPNCVEKLQELFLRDDILGLSEERILLLKKNETHLEILRQIRKFVNDDKLPADTMIFYFVGHGDIEHTEEKFCLVTNNTEKGFLLRSSIPWEEIKNILEAGTGIKQRLFIVDACHSGAIKKTLGDETEDADYNPNMEITPEGSVLIASAKAKDEAYFKDGDDYTYFTAEFIKILENGFNDKKTDGLETGQITYQLEDKLLRKKIAIDTGFSQDDNKIKKFVFFRNKNSRTIKARKRNLELEKSGDSEKEKFNFDKAEEIYDDVLAAVENKKVCQDIKNRIDYKLQEIKELKKFHKKYENRYRLKIDTFKNDIKKLEQEKAKLLAENKENKQKLNDLNKEISKLKQDLQKTIDNDKQVYDKLLSEKKNIETQNAQKNRDIKDLTAQIDKLKQQVTALTEKEKQVYSKLLAEKQQLEKENNKNKQQITSLNKQINTLEEANNKLKTELENLKNPPKPKTKNFTEKIGNTSFDMIFVEGGSFKMGSPNNDKDALAWEKPQHDVRLGDYYISKNAVTFAEFEQFINATGYKTQTEKDGKGWVYDGSDFKKISGINWRHDVAGNAQTNKQHPVIRVSWHDANEYCKWLSRKTGKNYSLPTEAEWEFAARGGNKSKGYKYSGSDNIKEVAWYDEHEGNKTHPVGELKANELGIYDMSGNVWEWCNDWFDKEYYKNSPSDNPQGASDGSYRVIRGGGWGNNATNCRVAYRYSINPAYSYYYVGFRAALR